jgi:type II thyroxine 5'-deiodinase
VYIEEAHPSDGWATGGDNPDIKQHRTQAERNAAAMQLLEVADPHCPVYIDTMDNHANHEYGALFERLYVLREGRVGFQGGRGPLEYSVAAMEAWLVQNVPEARQ